MEIIVGVDFIDNEVFKISADMSQTTLYVDKKEVDHPAKGPNPLELFLSSLGSCVGVYAKKYLVRHSLPFKSVSIKVRADFLIANPARLGNVTVVVSTDADLGDRKDAFLRFVKGCPIHNTILHTDSVSIELI